MTTLQETARMQFEANKKARRHVYQAAAARGYEWGALGPNTAPMHPQALSKTRQASNGSLRLRSGSGASGTTATSDSGEGDGLRASPNPHSYRQSSFSSTSSQPQSSAHSSTGSFARVPIPHNFGHSSSNMATVPSNQPSTSGSSNNVSTVSPFNPASVLSPIATRMRERDADAIAKFKKRNRSGSAGTSSGDTNSVNGVSGLAPMNGNGVQSLSGLVGTPHPVLRRLRPSMSAAQLRSSPPPLPISNNTSLDLPTPRSRSGTNPTLARPNPPTFSPPSETDEPYFDQSSGTLRRVGSRTRRGVGVPERISDYEDYTGPPSDYAIFPEPPTEIDSSNGGAKMTTPTARRAAFALLSKPLPHIELPGSPGGRHRRGTSTSELRG